MKFAKHTFLGHADGKSKMISGTKLHDAPVVAKPSPSDRPMTWRECPPDASRNNWEQVGTYFRTPYRRGWLIDRGSTYQYVPLAMDDEPEWEACPGGRRCRVEGGWMVKNNSGSLAFVPDKN